MLRQDLCESTSDEILVASCGEFAFVPALAAPLFVWGSVQSRFDAFGNRRNSSIALELLLLRKEFQQHYLQDNLLNQRYKIPGRLV